MIPFALVSLLVILRTVIEGSKVPAGPDYSALDTVVGQETSPMPTIMGDVMNSAYAYKVIFGPGGKNGTKAIGISPNNSDFSLSVSSFLKNFGLTVLTFESEEKLREYASNPTVRINKSDVNLTTGVSFDKQGENGEYSYKLLFDKDYIPDISDNFVDKLLA